MHRLPEPRFDFDYINSLSVEDGEFFALDERAIAVLSNIAQMVFWNTRWDNEPEDQASLESLQWEIYNQMATPLHFNDLIDRMDTLNTTMTAVKEAIEAIEIEAGDGLSAISGFLALLDPRLAVLIEVLDSIDDVIGGLFEPVP